MANLLWLQGGACSGNTMSFLNAEEPSACDLVTDFGINVLWQPSLGLELGDNVKAILEKCISGEIQLDIFVFEGTVINAPNGTGEWNRFCGRPMREWVKELSGVAQFVVALGDCATWGGIPATAPNPSDSEGLQFLKRAKGGALGGDFVSKAGLPVIKAVRPTPIGLRKSWSALLRAALATSRWMISIAPRRSSQASPRQAAPAICISPTRFRRQHSASARVACSTTWGAAAR